jgi:hypothetical protein
MLVGRSPRLYARGTLEALERKRLVLHPPPAEKRERNAAPTSICPGARGRPTQLTLVTPLRRLAETRQSVKKSGEASQTLPKPKASPSAHQAQLAHERRLEILRAHSRQSPQEQSSFGSLSSSD